MRQEATTGEYSYTAVLNAARRASWEISDVIGGDRRLDFSRALLPDALARMASLDTLSDCERRTLNQIRGNTYLGLFALVEEFILPFVEEQAIAGLCHDSDRALALARFAHEEAKHIRLFKLFRETFERGFRVPCAVIGPADEIARAVLAHHPLGVAFAILQIEWMTQRHYLESVRDDGDLDPLFASLLRHHWIEEAAHARLDTLLVGELARAASPNEIAAATLDYVKIIELLDRGLAQQAELELETLCIATGRALGCVERDGLLAQQHQALRWTFIGSGMTHPRFMQTMQRISPAGAESVRKMAQRYC